MSFIDFSGKKIMVVGAASGIGRQTSILLSQLGACVVLADRNENKLSDVMYELPDNKHTAITYDVKENDKCKELFDQAIRDGIKLDGLVYTVGIAKPVPLRVMSYQEYENIFSINYYGFINCVSLYAKRKYNNGGSIVGISAVNTHNPQKCMTLYAATKAAIEASVKTMSLELADQNIRINAVIPGAVATPMSENVNRETLNNIVSKQLLGIQKPEQIADFIAFLLSDRSGAVTGRSLYADGGMLGQQ